MSEGLDQADIDALLEAVSSGDVEAGPAALQIFSRVRQDLDRVEIRDYDFKRPERISKDQMRALQTLHETFARGLGASLTGFLRTIVEVRVVHTEQMTYSEFIGALPNPTSFNLITAEALDGPLCLELSPLIIYPIIDRLLGGSNHEIFIPQRSMTLIETRLIRRILARAVDALSEAWEGVIAMRFALGEMESNPHIVQIVPPNEVAVVIGFEIKMTDRAGTMSLCIPFNVIEPLMDRLSAQTWFTPGRHRGEQPWGRQIAGRLGRAGVDVSGILAETSITMAQLRGMEVGDVLTTSKPSASPVVLTVEGRPKFLAHIGQHKGHRALKIVRAVQPTDRL